jgi:TM2 domain-containing membrane protein YozV
MPLRAPAIAALLSLLLPGLGQLYNRERPKGVALLCMTAGITYGLVMSTVGPAAFRSVVTAVMLAVVSLFVWPPAVADAYQRAAGKPSTLLSGEKVWYVILMLLTVGPMALPLLWQSPRFSQGGKIGWTVAVILLALLGIAVLLFVGPAAERALQDLTPSLQGTP